MPFKARNSAKQHLESENSCVIWDRVSECESEPYFHTQFHREGVLESGGAAEAQ